MKFALEEEKEQHCTSWARPVLGDGHGAAPFGILWMDPVTMSQKVLEE